MQDTKICTIGGGDQYAEFDQDGTLAGNSDKVVPTQKAVKTYADAIGSAATGASIPIGYLDTDNTLAANSDIKVTSQKAVKAYVASFVDGIVGAVIDPTGIVLTATQATASGALPAFSYVQLNKADGAMALTSLYPTPGRFLVIVQVDAGTHGHTVTLTSGTFDGTNDTATFNAAGEALVLFGVSDSRYAILANIGSVGLSNP